MDERFKIQQKNQTLFFQGHEPVKWHVQKQQSIIITLSNFTTWSKQTHLERNDEVQEENHVDDSVYVWLLNGKNEKENRADQYPVLAEHAV